MSGEEKRQCERKKAAVDAAEALSNYVNNYSAKKDAFVEHITKHTHRTLQQSIGVLFVKLIKVWAEHYRQQCFDGRNEAFCKLAYDIDEHLRAKDGDNWGHLPFI